MADLILHTSVRKGDVSTNPFPLCCQCVKHRVWADKEILNKNGHRVGWIRSCDAYPKEVPQKCIRPKEHWDMDNATKICPHFVDGPVQWKKPRSSGNAV